MKRIAQLSPSKSSRPSRREFLQRGGRLAGASVLVSMAVPSVHAAEDNTIRLALIGSGNRGSGAVGNAMSVEGGPVKLVAMADLFDNRLTASLKALSKQFGDRIDVPPERQFVGFDAYRKAVDCLRPGDIAILTTYSGFRPTHLEYAVQKGVHVFMEKSIAPDPGGIRRVLKAGEAAKAKNLKVATGLMCRHSASRQELIRRIRDGALGQVQLVRAYRMEYRAPLRPRQQGDHELYWQIRNPERLLWVAGGYFHDRTIHLVDEMCWLKDSWPVAAHGVGGRSLDAASDLSQDLHSYSIEYTFADGTKGMVVGRYLAECYPEFATFVHGTKCAAQFSGSIHAPTVRIHQDQRIARDTIAWEPPKEQVSPYQEEWRVLLDAIRSDRPHNEVERSAYSDLATIMGRAAVHSGKIVTWDEALASDFRFCPDIDRLTSDSSAPAKADAAGCYPIPVPGQWSEI
ncbi:MAG: Gfo/Idh/MocA family oxidoreductase [Rhodopirellula sp.]|nr:Gfo/Idh/MocA family oxidoreductase [Rhodopirellula sp.]